MVGGFSGKQESLKGGDEEVEKTFRSEGVGAKCREVRGYGYQERRRKGEGRAVKVKVEGVSVCERTCVPKHPVEEKVRCR